MPILLFVLTCLFLKYASKGLILMQYFVRKFLNTGMCIVISIPQSLDTEIHVHF